LQQLVKPIHIFDTREGTSWHSQGSIQLEPNNSWGANFIALNKKEGGYALEASMITKN
jgi:hypothetical protein